MAVVDRSELSGRVSKRVSNCQMSNDNWQGEGRFGWPSKTRGKLSTVQRRSTELRPSLALFGRRRDGGLVEDDPDQQIKCACADVFASKKI